LSNQGLEGGFVNLFYFMDVDRNSRAEIKSDEMSTAIPPLDKMGVPSEGTKANKRSAAAAVSR
jgi:hypothetical protein